MNEISVGIDASKGKSMVCVLRPLGEVLAAPFETAHTVAEIRKLVDFLRSLEGDVRIILESTGRYHEPVLQSLCAAGFFVCAINPKLIKDYGNNSLRKIKTDKADAVKIARYGLEHWNELRAYTPQDNIRVKLKEFSRQFNLYGKMRTALKNNLIALLDQTFPGVCRLFTSPAKTDGRQKWVDFITTFWHSDCVTSSSVTAFTERYRKWCKRHGYRFSETKAQDLYLFSRNCYATLPHDSSTKSLITEATVQLNAISRTVEFFRTELFQLASYLPEFPVVMDLYGVGKTTGPQLMAEIGDVRRFSSRKAIVAYAGVDPGDSQSGQYKAQSYRTSKRGSPHLRKVLFQTVHTYLKRQPGEEPVFQFLARKRAEGKKYYVYMTAAANKFLRIYYARVREYLTALELNT